VRVVGNRPLAVAGGLTLLWLLAGAGLAVWFSGRIQDWSVMTDELLYAKLATSIAETGSPLPRVHGASVSVYNQLYPLLLAPLYGTLSPPDAFRAGHVLNAFVMTSAVFPAYLLARQVVGRGWALAVAALSVLLPWMLLTGFLMTESAAYPAFLWAVLGLQLAIAEPSPRRDVLAVAALALAVLARTQFAALALVLPLAIVGHELALTRSLRPALARHRVLAVVYAVGALIAIALAIAGSLGDLLGVYAVTVEGSILPVETWSAAAEHIDAVAIGSGLVPLILGGGWLLATVVRSREPREHALATLYVLTIVVLTIVAASFAVRFGRDGIVYDRYLFYVAPLLLVATAAALAGAARRRVAIGAAVVAVFFAATAPLLPFTEFAGINVDSPPMLLNELLNDQSGSLSTGTYVALLGLLVGLVVVLALLFAPRVPLAVVTFAALGVFSLLTLRSEVNRVLDGTALSGRPLAGDPGLVLEWVDTVVPDDESAGLVPFPVSTAWDTTVIRWWDVEFWNRSVDRAFLATDGNFSYTPYPHEALDVDWQTGEIPGTDDAPRFVITAPFDPRLGLDGRTHADNVGLVVRDVERPYRARWATRGLQTDGWTTPGRPATIRVFNHGDDDEAVQLLVAVRAAPTAGATYRLATRAGTLAPGEERGETILLCIPGGSAADVTVRSRSDARFAPPLLGPTVEGTRRVGVLLGPIEVRRDGPC
jgi:hypothetical protein